MTPEELTLENDQIRRCRNAARAAVKALMPAAFFGPLERDELLLWLERNYPYLPTPRVVKLSNGWLLRNMGGTLQVRDKPGSDAPWRVVSLGLADYEAAVSLFTYPTEKGTD